MPAKLLICTDLDRTLIPNGPATESPDAARLFGLLAERPEVTLAYVSGRHRELVEAAMAEYDLPVPDFVIGDVGTTIYRVGKGLDWQRYAAWEKVIARDWGGRDHASLADLLSNLKGLERQEASRQNRFKLSYYIDDPDDSAELGTIVNNRLQSAQVQARVVVSIDEISGQGLLDVLPRNASKRHAIEALMEDEGFTRDETVFCGDSGNDLEVLGSPIPAVLVANALAEVKLEATRRSHQAGCADRLYIARGGFRGMNGNYRGGMLEGIAHYHPSISDWLQDPGTIAAGTAP
jgi:hypothetical protein